MVSKIELQLTPLVIAEMFKLPREAPVRMLEEQDPSLEKIDLAKLLANKKEAVWLGLRFPKASLSPKCNVLHRLVYSHFLPQAYVSSVFMDHATFIEKLLKGVHVDLAKYIFDIIDLVAQTLYRASGLPFGGIITWFLVRNGVKQKRG